MLRSVVDIVAGVGFLIGMFLVLSRADASVKIVNSLAANSVQAVKALQGR